MCAKMKYETRRWSNHGKIDGTIIIVIIIEANKSENSITCLLTASLINCYHVSVFLYVLNRVQ